MDFLFHHMLRNSASKYPDKEAIVHREKRLTYLEFQNEVIRYANNLLRRNCLPNERVGLLLPPGIPLAASLFATSLASGIFVPIHHSLFSHQIEHIIRDCDIQSMISCKSLVEKIPATSRSNLKNLFLTDKENELDGLNSTLDILTFDDHQSDQPLEFGSGKNEQNRVENDLAGILYTSGSTGLPKGVMLSHKNIVAGASIVSNYLKITDADRILAALPLSFDAGLNQLTTGIQQGATVVLINFMFAREIVAELNKEEITGLAGVPPLWNLLVQDNSTLKKSQPTSLRYVTNTGGAVPTELLSKIQSCVSPQTEIVLMYGLTEAFRSTYLPFDELPKRPGSMGKAIPNSEILVLRDDGSECAANETGELVHRGPTVALGYWGNQKATAKVFRNHPQSLPGSGIEEKVVFSGDLVYKDQDGFLYFVGRKDTLIKSSGFRISPTEVESGIMQSGEVQQAAVVGIPDKNLGHAIVGFVQMTHSIEFDAASLLANLSEFLPRHMLPKRLYQVLDFPKTSSGKIDYPSLKQTAEKKCRTGVRG